MQEVQRSDGTFIRQFFQARNEQELKKQMKEQYERAMIDDVESIRQVVLDPDSVCPCGSAKKTKNCCIRRLDAYIKRQEWFAAH